MPKTMVICGFGTGVSTAVAERFGAEGFAIAAIARNPQRLSASVAQLQAKNITAAAFPADANDSNALRAALADARKALGAPSLLHWNAYNNDAGDLLKADATALQAVLGLATSSLVTAIQMLLPDLKAAQNGAVLITNGAFGDLNPQVDTAAVGYNSMGLALANAAKHKLTGLLAARLKPERVYVGEAMITGSIKGSAWADAHAMDASRVADAFWKLYQTRTATYARV